MDYITKLLLIELVLGCDKPTQKDKYEEIKLIIKAHNSDYDTILDWIARNQSNINDSNS